MLKSVATNVINKFQFYRDPPFKTYYCVRTKVSFFVPDLLISAGSKKAYEDKITWICDKKFNNDGEGYPSVQKIRQAIEKRHIPKPITIEGHFATLLRKTKSEWIITAQNERPKITNALDQGYDYIIIDPDTYRCIELIY